MKNETAQAFTDQEVVDLLAENTYDQVRDLTGWSRGRIYQAACRLGARKHERRIAQRARERAQMQAEFMAEAMGGTARMDVLDLDTRRERLARVMPELVSLLPGVTDQSVAVWQAEARKVERSAQPINTAAEHELLVDSL